MLQGHGNHIEADDEGDEDVQVVAGTHGVDEQPGRTIGGIVGQPLGLCRGVWGMGVGGGGMAQTTEGWGPGREQSTWREQHRGGRKQGERRQNIPGPKSKS